MEPTIRYGNIYSSSGMHDLQKSSHDNDGKLQDCSDRCDSGIDSYPSTDYDSRSISFPAIDEKSITTDFSKISVSNPAMDSTQNYKSCTLKYSLV